MPRYLAVDNTNATSYAGWELVDTEEVPPRTIAVCMPQMEAQLAAAAMNKVDDDSARLVALAFQCDALRQSLRQCEARLTLLIERDQHKLLDVTARDEARRLLA